MKQEGVSEKIGRFEDFFNHKYKHKILDNHSKGKKRVTIDFKDLAEYDPDLGEELLDRPEDTFKIAEAAISNIIEGKLTVRVRGLPPSSNVRIRDLRAELLDKFVAVEGEIVTKSDVATKIVMASWECTGCANIVSLPQFDETLNTPLKCGCGNPHFKMKSRKLMNCFTLRIEELSRKTEHDMTLKWVPVLCEDDLTDIIVEERLVEGMSVRINGVYKDKLVVKNGKKQTTLLTYLNANYIEHTDKTFSELEISGEDEKQIGVPGALDHVFVVFQVRI